MDITAHKRMKIAELISKCLHAPDEIKIVMELTEKKLLSEFKLTGKAKDDWFNLLSWANDQEPNQVFNLIDNVYQYDTKNKYLAQAFAEMQSTCNKEKLCIEQSTYTADNACTQHPSNFRTLYFLSSPDKSGNFSIPVKVIYIDGKKGYEFEEEKLSPIDETIWTDWNNHNGLSLKREYIQQKMKDFLDVFSYHLYNMQDLLGAPTRIVIKLPVKLVGIPFDQIIHEGMSLGETYEVCISSKDCNTESLPLLPKVIHKSIVMGETIQNINSWIIQEKPTLVLLEHTHSPENLCMYLKRLCVDGITLISHRSQSTTNILSQMGNCVSNKNLNETIKYLKEQKTNIPDIEIQDLFIVCQEDILIDKELQIQNLHMPIK